MDFIASPLKIFGLDISDLSIKIVQIEGSPRKKKIRVIVSHTLPAGLIVDGVINDADEVAKILKRMIAEEKGINTPYASVSLPETKTFIKVISIASANDIDQSPDRLIAEELPKHIPMSIEETLIDWRVVSRHFKKQTFLVGAVEKNTAESYYRVCQLAGVEPVAFEIEAEAIMRALSPCTVIRQTKNNLAASPEDRCPADEPTRMIIDLGANRASLILSEGRVIHFTRSFKNLGGRAITDNIAARMKLAWHEAEKAKIICGTNPRKCRGLVRNLVDEMIAEIAREITSGFEYYQSHFQKSPDDLSVVLCGGGANLNGLSGVLLEKLRRTVSVADPLLNVEIKNSGEKRKNLLSYTTAIGLALRFYENV